MGRGDGKHCLEHIGLSSSKSCLGTLQCPFRILSIFSFFCPALESILTLDGFVLPASLSLSLSLNILGVCVFFYITIYG